MYYQSLSDYYQNQSKTYAQKAKVELLEAQKEKNFSPAKIKNSQPWTGTNLGLAFVINSGDANSQNLNSSSFVSYKPNKASTTTWNTRYEYAHDNDKGQLSNNFYTDLNSAYNFDFKNGIYGDVNYSRNKFSGYTYQMAESIGYNRVFFDSRTYSLSSQIGPGLQQSLTNNSPSTYKNEITANLKILSNYNLSDQINWKETYTLMTGNSYTLSTLDSAASILFFAPFSLELDHLISYTPTPQPNKTQWNTATTLTIAYNF
jgi:putative salt-induced outer membrane protein YdiY